VIVQVLVRNDTKLPHRARSLSIMADRTESYMACVSRSVNLANLVLFNVEAFYVDTRFNQAEVCSVAGCAGSWLVLAGIDQVWNVF
jgi:hypothetical protein